MVRKQIINWMKALSYPADPSITWINTAEQLPEPGQYIVKYWTATGNMWAGKHIANPKHESFDKWLPAPIPKDK